MPADRGGTWHTHVTRDQLLNPENSHPDWANVAFGVIDVSIVVGAETSEVVVGSADRSVMQHKLRQDLGVEVDSVEEVAEAILDGEVPDPSVARARLRQQLHPLVFEVDTAFPDLAEEVRTSDDLATMSAIVSGDRRYEMVAACPMYDLAAARSRFAGDGPFDQIRALARAKAEDLVQLSKQALPPEDVDIRATVWGTAIGFFVSNAISDLLTS